MALRVRLLLVQVERLSGVGPLVPVRVLEQERRVAEALNRRTRDRLIVEAAVST
jgi:hypothetical protein